MGGLAEELHRPRVEDGRPGASSHRLPHGQGQHRPLRQGVGAEEQKEIAAAHLLQAAGQVLGAGRSGPGGLVPPRMDLEDDLGAADVPGPALQQEVGLQGGASRAEKGDALRTVFRGNLREPGADFLQRLRPEDLTLPIRGTLGRSGWLAWP